VALHLHEFERADTLIRIETMVPAVAQKLLDAAVNIRAQVSGERSPE